MDAINGPDIEKPSKAQGIKNLLVDDQGEEEDEEEFLVMIYFAVLLEFSTKDGCI